MEVRLFGSGALPSACRKRALLERACKAALGPAARRAGEVNVIFTGRAEMRRINRRYLDHDYDTDVIAFPYAAPPARGGEPAPFGDIYVSVAQAERQAAELEHPLLEELLTLVVHGALHLAGYRDGTAAERRRMFARQARLLRPLAASTRRGRVAKR